MKYLCINSSSSDCVIALFGNDQEISYISWNAHRTLADEIFIKIEQLLNTANLSYDDIDGLVIYSGPGSFTGLRISHTVFNTLAYSLHIPIVGSDSHEWIQQGIKRLQKNENDKIAVPVYGGLANISKPKK
jgi:tRNA threonylcarbamoyladenosine biosynthesis protein TsaB